VADLPGGGFGGEFDLAVELRDQLGLEEGERLRALRTTAHTVVLERTGGDSAIPVPWDRELVLSADVQSFPLADLLSLVHSSGKSGFLVFSKEAVVKSVYLSRGEVVFASSNQQSDRLGESLMRDGLITLDQLRDTESRWSPTERFGKILVESGAITARELWNGVKDQVEAIVRSLFAYTEGFVHFWEGEVEPDNVVRLSLPTRRLIAEGLEQRDELLRFVAHLEDTRVALSTTPGARDTLGGNGRAIYDAIGERDRFPSVCRRAGFDPVSTARTLQLLKMVGAVEVLMTPDEMDLLVDTDKRGGDDERLRALVLDHVKLMAELIAPIVMVDGQRAMHERLCGLLQDVSASHPGLLAGVELAAGCVLDPDEIAERALRLPGNREAAVCEGLGELISYVEFELKNHPRIEEADRFLDAVEELRANIQI
jgi:hypothetical protein